MNWSVTFPFDAQAEQLIRKELSSSSINASFVRVHEGHVSGLHVKLKSTTEAHRDLLAVISTIKPTREYPLLLKWDLIEVPLDSADRRFSGSVDVAGCRYFADHASEKEPQKYYTPEALDLQRLLRDQFDIC